MNDVVHVGARTELETSQIVMLESSVNYTYLTLDCGKRLLVSYTLKKLAERLSEHKSFIRPNRSCVVNLKYLNKVTEDSLTINHKKIPISRRRKPEIMANCGHLLSKKHK